MDLQPGTNRWNQLIYAGWAPFYDLLVERTFIKEARRTALGYVDLQAVRSLLLIGVGTGADLEFLLPHQHVLAIDLSRAMLARAQQRQANASCQVELVQADAEALPLADAAFDAALLTLVLSVVEHPQNCLDETLRVLKPGGRALVFDKFLPPGRSAPVWRSLLNQFTRFFGTDINRSFEPLIARREWDIVREHGVLFGNHYRAIVLEKRLVPRSSQRNTGASHT